MSRLLEWMSRGQALRNLRAAQEGQAERAHLERARAAVDLADHALDPSTSPSPRWSAGIATDLYAQAVFFCLHHEGSTSHGDLASAWDQEKQKEYFTRAAGGAENLPALRAILLDTSAHQASRTDSQLEDQIESAHTAGAFAHRLLAAFDAESNALYRLLFQRLYRSLLVGGVLGGAVLILVWLAIRRPDLAVGKPWEASSALDSCALGETHDCQGQQVKIFFHTREEDAPWLMVDLQQARNVSRVLVQNRRDCCGERAVPLHIEISRDKHSWRTVARRLHPFEKATMSFKPVTARYVRLSVPRRTTLHFERVSVY